MTAEKLADLLAKSFKVMVGPLVVRLKAVEERTQQVAALEARVHVLERRLRSDGAGEVIDAETGDGLGGA